MLGHHPISDQPISSLPSAGSSTAYTLTGDAGSYVLAGQDATFAVAYAVDGDAGGYAIAGQDATFSVGNALAGDAGAYTLDGQDATFTVTTGSTAYTLDGEAGAYVIAGQDATFTLSTDVVPETRRRAGGRLVRKRYLIRGKFYWLTDDELSVLIAQELADISRRDVKVAAPKAKPRVISAEAWAAVKPLARLEALAERMVEDDGDDEDELILMMV